MTYLLKNVRTGKSRTSEWYEGGLYDGETKVGSVAFDGNGAPAFITWDSPESREKHFSSLHRWAFARSYGVPEGNVLSEHDIAETLYLVWLNNKRSKENVVMMDTESNDPLNAQVMMHYGFDLKDTERVRNLLGLYPQTVFWDVKNERFIPLVRVFRD